VDCQEVAEEPLGDVACVSQDGDVVKKQALSREDVKDNVSFLWQV